MFPRRRASRPTPPAPLGAAPGRARGSGRAGSGCPTRQAAGLLAWFARPRVRRALAAVLALTVLSFSFESLIADVHDGDAPAAELAHAPEVSRHSGDGTPVHVAAHATGRAESGQAGLMALSSRDGSSSAPDRRVPGDAPASSHSVHVCHSAHEHVAAVVDLPRAADLAAAHGAARPAYVPHALSRATEPPVRPPIA